MSNITRRQFLEDSILAAAAAASLPLPVLAALFLVLNVPSQAAAALNAGPTPQLACPRRIVTVRIGTLNRAAPPG